MRISRLLPLVAIWSHSLGYNLFRAPLEKPTINDQSELLDVTSDFHPTELLDSTSRRPEVYTKAMLELKRLEEQPVCHRLAAQLLMNNCRGLEGVDERNYDINSVHLQRHHVESFAASLAICDLERARVTIPRSCSQFKGLALQQAARDGNRKLEVTPKEVEACLASLALDPSHWSTWISYRDKALLFCKAARLDIDKDQFILLHKKLTEIMETFTGDLEKDLDTMRRKMTDNERDVDSYFEKMSGHLEDWTSKVQGSFESVSIDVDVILASLPQARLLIAENQVVKSSVKSVVDSTGNAVHMMEKFIKTFLQGHAEMADEQEKALTETTNKIQSRMTNLADLLGEAKEGTLEVTALLQIFISMLFDVQSRQASLEEQSTTALSNMVNATELLQTHMQKLAQAESAVSGISENLNRASEAVKSWSENVPVGGRITDWAFRIGAPVAALILGNYGITPTWNMNAVFILGGLVGGETLVQLRHLELPYNWRWMWWSGSNSKWSSETHLPQEQVKSSLAMTPVEIESTSASTTMGSSFHTAHLDMA